MAVDRDAQCRHGVASSGLIAILVPSSRRRRPGDVGSARVPRGTGQEDPMTPLIDEGFTIRTGQRVRLRPVKAGDAPALAEMIDGLSPLARRRRFHGAVTGLSAARLHDMTHLDGHRQIGLVAAVEHDGALRLVADARCVTDASDSAAEFALVVAEGWRGRGIARRCLAALRRAAAEEGLHWLYGHVQADNLPMLALLRRCGFALSAHRGDAGLVVAEARCVRPTAPLPPTRLPQPARAAASLGRA
ncbi:GNAT family N-acetyltransferase [Piscinibacter aquaticus]|uniref:GNAT family N-acetyltransferase n=1 Tax=Piscinibacter aquaticus TaxID=392597 RepID=A0A5C6U308_9BURK|nr:GNAT family N-acetyltransferase [Piscinibacter aquaticus]